MAQGRVILKTISTSQKLARVNSHRARLLYSWVMAHADVNGNFYGDEKIIKSIVVPLLSYRLDKIRHDLHNLEKNRLLFGYVSGGERYIHINKFAEKQPYLRLDRDFPKFPIPPKCPQGDSQIPPEVKGSELKRKEVKGRRKKDFLYGGKIVPKNRNKK